MLELSEPVRAIMARVSEITGKGFDLVEKKDLVPHAGIKIARRGMPSHLIHYRSVRGGILNHLIAHECAHAIRMCSVPEERRLVPASNRQTMTAALKPMLTDIERISRTIPRDKAPEYFNMLYHGLVRQLTNFPSDIAIEKWLYDEYPALRDDQMQSLLGQRDEAAQAITSSVRDFTPGKIYQAANVMNYTFFKLLGEHTGKRLLGRFERAGFEDRGNALAALTAEGPSATYEDDIAMVNRWAEFFGLKDWFMWVGFEQVEDGYATS